MSNFQCFLTNELIHTIKNLPRHDTRISTAARKSAATKSHLNNDMRDVFNNLQCAFTKAKMRKTLTQFTLSFLLAIREEAKFSNRFILVWNFHQCVQSKRRFWILDSSDHLKQKFADSKPKFLEKLWPTWPKIHGKVFRHNQNDFCQCGNPMQKADLLYENRQSGNCRIVASAMSHRIFSSCPMGHRQLQP